MIIDRIQAETMQSSSGPKGLNVKPASRLKQNAIDLFLRNNKDDAHKRHAEAFEQLPVYDEVSWTYEAGLLLGSQLQTHANNQLNVFHAMQASREGFQGSESEYRLDLKSRLPDLLLHLVDQDLLDLSIYKPSGDDIHGYGKYLLFTNPDTAQPYCLQLFAFAVGQKTPIHDHPCECMSVLLKGNLLERFYKVDTENPNKVQKIDKVPRSVGSTGLIDLGHLDIPHSLKNKANAYSGDAPPSETMAISVHLYEGIDGSAHESDSVSSRRTQLAEERKGSVAVSRVFNH